MARASGTSDAIKALQSLAAQAATAARSMADDLAEAAERATPEPLARMGAQLTQLSTLWVQPVRSLLDQQREFFEVMSSWAAQQRVFADQMVKLAETNQKVTEQLSAVLGPVLEQAEAAQKRATSRTSKR